MWWTVFAVAMAGTTGFALHMFGQGFWYRAHALEDWGTLTSEQARRQRKWAVAIALLVAPAWAVGIFVLLMAGAP